MNEKLNDLVKEWTKEAQSIFNNDQESAIYYICSKELYDILKEYNAI